MPLSRKYSPMAQRRCKAPGTAAEPGRTRSRRRRWSIPSRRILRASSRSAPRSNASGLSRHTRSRASCLRLWHSFTDFWFRMVSIATAVLPVWRSPMINSRWPRPTGIRRVERLEAGLHRLMHRLTRDNARGFHFHTTDAQSRRSGPCHRSGCPGRQHAAQHALPDGPSTIAPVRFTVSPSLMPRSSPKITTPTLSISRFSAMPLCPSCELDHFARLDVDPDRRRGPRRHRRTAPGQPRQHRLQSRSWRSVL